MPSLADYNALKATQATEIARIKAIVDAQAKEILALKAAAIANEVPQSVIDGEQADVTTLIGIT